MQKREDLRLLLNRSYDRETWLDIVRTVLPNVSLLRSPQPLAVENPAVKSFFQLGNVRLEDGRNLALFEVEVNDQIDVARNRVGLRNLLAGLIDQETNHGAFGIFNSGGDDYRLTLAARDSYFTEDGDYVETQTTPKRYTYVLGRNEVCNTAARRLWELHEKKEKLKLDDVIDAFSVERLNKEFYGAIRKYFVKLVGGMEDGRKVEGVLTLPEAAQADFEIAKEFAVRLLGRTIFCWFLKHKRLDHERPLIPGYLLSSEAVEKNAQYYHNVLEKLFFQMLNKPMAERNQYLPQGAHLVPFLNGGLFEPRHHDYYTEAVLGASRQVNTLKIPDDWFHDFFTTLEQYNFTIDENTVTDAEVSVDPEILGCIFENLLAEINPETGESARKATGSFYTPREIVDYMVEESLLAYLEQEVAKTKVVETLLRKGCPPHPLPKTFETFPEGTASACGIGGAAASTADSASLISGARGVEIPRQGSGGSAPAEVLPDVLRHLFDESSAETELPGAVCKEIVRALGRIKVLDPACGSGAFPVGMLQKILCVLRKVDPSNDMFFDQQIELIKDRKLTKADEDKLLEEIQHAYETNAADYFRKLGIIQNSIYGVDIQPVAVEIAKLRFFLTLVVDEQIDDSPGSDNRGILPLPNLDFKFVAANSLVAAPELPEADDANLLGLTYTDPFFEQFADAARDYFYARDPAEKAELRGKIEKAIGDQVHAHMKQIQDLTFHKNDRFRQELERKHAKQLADLTRDAGLWHSYANLFRGDEAVDFFDPKYMFPDAAAGFDVVIGNPPYVRQEKIKDQKPLFQEQYGDDFTSTADLYVYFYLRGLDLLRHHGHLCYISSNKYFRAGYGENLRNCLSSRTRIRQLIDFGDAPVFTAIAYPSIMLTSKVGVSHLHTPDQRESRLPLDSHTVGAGIGSDRHADTIPFAADSSPDESERIAAEAQGTFETKKEESATPDKEPRTTNCQRHPDSAAFRGTQEPVLRAFTWSPGPPIADFANQFRKHAFEMRQANLDPNGWQLERPEILERLNHMRAVGTPLGEYVKGRFYYGIKTGFNEAFVIDRATRDRLIAEDPKSAEIIKPFLRGRDVKRWRVNFAEQYLIFTRRGIDIDKYPAIKKHLSQYRKQLEPKPKDWKPKRSGETWPGRKAGPYEWYEIQDNIAYWQEFEGPKIIYPDIAVECRFCLDYDKLYPDCTLFLIPEGSKFLLGVLNSSSIRFAIDQITPRIRGGFFRFKSIYMKDLPIPPATPEQKAEIESLVDQILTAKSANPAADVVVLEKCLDRKTARLFGFNAK
jgi:hypothetical protein